MIRRTLPGVLIAGVLAALFVTFFSATTSFLNPAFGGDSAIFRLIGTSMSQGQELYVDVWDHKGPGLFLIQWFAQLIGPGRVGLFLLQILSLSLTLWLLGRIAARFLSPLLVVCVQVVFLALLAPLYEYGNLTEEWTLPFSLFALWSLSRAWHTEDGAAGRWALALSGAALSFVFFIRLNNAAVILAAFVAYFVYVLIAQRPFWTQFLTAIAGFLVACAAFLVSFALAGALPEMLHATFLYNLSYSTEGATDPTRMLSNGYLLLGLGLGVLTVVGGFIDAQRNGRPWYLILTLALAVIGSAATLTAANAYYHYLQLLVPGAALGVILVVQLLSGSLRWIAAAVCVVFAAVPLVAYAQLSASLSERTADAEYSAQVAEILGPVPGDQRDEVFTWNVESRFLLIADLLPNHRFYTLQDWWGRSDPIVYEELREFFAETPPEWLVTSPAAIGEPEIAKRVATEYQEVSRTKSLVLFERVVGP